MLAKPALHQNLKVGYTISFVGKGNLPDNYGPYYQFLVNSDSEVWHTFDSVPFLRAYQIAKSNGAEYITFIPIEDNTYDALYEARHTIEAVSSDVIIPVGFENDSRVYTLISNICQRKTLLGNPSFAMQSFIGSYNDLISSNLFSSSDDTSYSNIFNSLVYAPGYGNFSRINQYDIDIYPPTTTNINGLAAVAVASAMSSTHVGNSIANMEVNGIRPENIYTPDEIENITNAGAITIYKDGKGTFRISNAVSYHNKSDAQNNYIIYKDLLTIRIIQYCARIVSSAVEEYVGSIANDLGDVKVSVDTVLTQAVNDEIITGYRYNIKKDYISATYIDLLINLYINIKNEIKTINVQFRRSV